jgi:P4 family phage/plasmid primase-like protien
MVDQRGYRTVGADWREKLSELGIPTWAIRSDDAFPGLVLPMYRISGEFIGFQFKPANPQPKPGSDKPVKYIGPRGMGNRLDVHPACGDRVRDTAAPLWITEGVKKSDALAGRGLAAVTLTGVWNWRNQKGSLGDWEDVPLKDRTVVVCFDSDAPTNPHVRNAMVRLVGWLRSKGATAYYLPVPDKVGETPVKGVDDYLAAGGSLEALRAVASERAPGTGSSRDAAFSDALLTDTVCQEVLDGSFLYARGLGWMRYDGARWTEAGEALIVEEIRQWARGHWEEVVEEYKSDQSSAVRSRMDGWRQILASSRLKALASLARGPMHTEASEFDSHADLLNTPSGVVDLVTGELLESDPEYRFTKITGVPYVPGATDPDFDQALCALPDDVRDWYRMRVGQAFTGHMPPDDMMLVQQGSGENGKSTLAVPVTRAAGGYHVLVSDRVILGNADQHPTELMDLMGARVALMEETPEARQLNVQQLKKVVGTPSITARRIRQDSVTFPATHSLFVNTNFQPAVVETDHATWRRLALVRFPYTFRKDPEDVSGPMDRLGDPALRERCMTREAPAVAALTWAVRGAVEWYARGKVFPAVPERVVEDTDAWRMEGDLIMAFADECLDFGPEYATVSADMYQEFGRWLGPTGHKAWTQKTFHSRFGGHDRITGRRVEHERKKIDGTVQRRWWGVRIKPNREPVGGNHIGNPFAPPMNS